MQWSASWEAWLSGQNKALSDHVQRLKTLEDLPAPQTYRGRHPQRPSHFLTESQTPAWEHGGALGSALTSDFKGGASPCRSYSTCRDLAERDRGGLSQDIQGERALFTFQWALLFQRIQCRRFPQQWWDVRVPHVLQLRLAGWALCLQCK